MSDRIKATVFVSHEVAAPNYTAEDDPSCARPLYGFDCSDVAAWVAFGAMQSSCMRLLCSQVLAETP